MGSMKIGFYFESDKVKETKVRGDMTPTHRFGRSTFTVFVEAVEYIDALECSVALDCRK